MIIEESFALIENAVKMRHENNEEFAKNTKNLCEFSAETELKEQCFLDASNKLFEQIPKIKETFKKLSGETIDAVVKDKKPETMSTVLLIIGCAIGAILFIGVICIFVHFYKNSQTTQDLP